MEFEQKVHIFLNDLLLYFFRMGIFLKNLSLLSWKFNQILLITSIVKSVRNKLITNNNKLYKI